MKFVQLFGFAIVMAVTFATFPVVSYGDTPLDHATKISMMEGGFIGPLEEPAYFGVSLASAGPADGYDGRYCFAGAVRNGALNLGAVWSIKLNPDGSVLTEFKIDGSVLDEPLDNGDGFGQSLALVDDYDGNGVRDLGVGVNEDVDGLSNAGSVWIIYMAANGQPLDGSFTKLTNGVAGMVFQNQEEFGHSLAYIGDIDNNGWGDLAVGSFHDLSAPPDHDSGAVWILLMGSDATVESWRRITSGESGFDEVFSDMVHFGASVASLGDIDGPGGSALALAVGSTLDDSGDPGGLDGAVYIIFLDDTGLVLNYTKTLTPTPGIQFGSAVSAMADRGGNGLPDLCVGTQWGFNREAGFWMYSVTAAGELTELDLVTKESLNFDWPLEHQDFFGRAITPVGDLDGDGIEDLAVGAFQDDDGGTMGLDSDLGAVYILFLNDPTDPVEENLWFEAMQFDFSLANLHDVRTVDALHMSNPRVVFSGGSGNTAATIACCGIEDPSPVVLPATPTDRWCRVPDGSNGWWFFPEVDPDQVTPSLEIVFDAPGILDADALGIDVDWILYDGAEAVTCGVTRFECGVPAAIPEPNLPDLDRSESSLGMNHPNPFNPRTTISYTVGRRGVVRLDVFNASGRRVRTLIQKMQEPGLHEVSWDGRDDSGQAMSSGTYYYRIATATTLQSRSMILLK